MDSWNPVLNMVVDIKKAFITENGDEHLFDKAAQYNNLLSYWIHSVSNPEPKWLYLESNTAVTQYGSLMLIKYNDLGVDWKIYDGIMMECRSVTIDIYHDCLVLVPFRKFRNLNECPENQLGIVQEEMKHATYIAITEKLDGSMVAARWYHDRLVVSGSQALDREQSFRLNNYYNWFANHQNAVKMLKNMPHITFVFEGIFPDDPHVVQYDESMYGLHLVGMRCVDDGFEISYRLIKQVAEKYNIPSMKIFNKTFDEALAEVNADKVKSNEAEGFVISIDQHRIKLKFKDFVAMHRVISRLVSPNFILDSIKDSKYDDVYSKIPEAYRPQVKSIYNNVNIYYGLMNQDVQKYYNALITNNHDFSNRKETMIWITDNVPKCYQGYVRNKYLGKENDYLKGRKYKDIVDWVEENVYRYHKQ